MRRNPVLFSLPSFLSLFSFLLFCPIVPFLAAGCGTTDPPSTRNTMSAMVDRTAWRGVEMTARRQEGTIVIEGRSAIDTRILLKLHGDTAGTYPLGTIVNEGIFIDETSQWQAFGVNSGSVTVTVADSLRVAGHFGFRAKDTAGIEQPREITGGAFDVDLAP